MKTELAVTEAEIRQIMGAVSVSKQYNFELHSIADGECTLHIPFRATFERPGGIVSGPVYMAAADVAMWLAIMTKLGSADEFLTSELNTAFLSAAKQEDIRCTATVLKLGRRLVYGVAECVNLDGKRLTHHTVTYARR